MQCIYCTEIVTVQRRLAWPPAQDWHAYSLKKNSRHKVFSRGALR